MVKMRVIMKGVLVSLAVCLCVLGLVGCQFPLGDTTHFDGRIKEYFGRDVLELPYAWRPYKFDTDFLSKLSLEEQKDSLVAAGYEATIFDNYEGRVLCVARVQDGAKSYWGIVEQKGAGGEVYYKTSNFTQLIWQECKDPGVIVVYTPFFPNHLVSEMVWAFAEEDESKTVVESDFVEMGQFYESVNQSSIRVDYDKQTVTLVIESAHFLILSNGQDTLKNKNLQVVIGYHALDVQKGVLDMSLLFV
ncbi:MAG: hypothetical protein FWD76_04415 [Firmicutes bacterium]|nr:hypothetical protein [Bacillota bacterium]